MNMQTKAAMIEAMIAGDVTDDDELGTLEEQLTTIHDTWMERIGWSPFNEPVPEGLSAAEFFEQTALVLLRMCQVNEIVGVGLEEVPKAQGVVTVTLPPFLGIMIGGGPGLLCALRDTLHHALRFRMRDWHDEHAVSFYDDTLETVNTVIATFSTAALLQGIDLDMTPDIMREHPAYKAVKAMGGLRQAMDEEGILDEGPLPEGEFN